MANSRTIRLKNGLSRQGVSLPENCSSVYGSLTNTLTIQFLTVIVFYLFLIAIILAYYRTYYQRACSGELCFCVLTHSWQPSFFYSPGLVYTFIGLCCFWAFCSNMGFWSSCPALFKKWKKKKEPVLVGLVDLEDRETGYTEGDVEDGPTCWSPER